MWCMLSMGACETGELFTPLQGFKDAWCWFHSTLLLYTQTYVYLDVLCFAAHARMWCRLCDMKSPIVLLSLIMQAYCTYPHVFQQFRRGCDDWSVIKVNKSISSRRTTARSISWSEWLLVLTPDAKNSPHMKTSCKWSSPRTLIVLGMSASP